MKRLIAFLLICLLTPHVVPASASGGLPPERRLVPFEFYDMKSREEGTWVSDSPDIASVDKKGVVTAMKEGKAAIRMESGGQTLFMIRILVEANPQVPETISRAIDLGISEWAASQCKTFKRSNKYTTWYYGPTASFGWCGAFTSFSLGEAGVFQEPTDTWRSLKPMLNGLPHGVREAGVPKLLAGYTNLDRITHIPRPGYLVIYGNRGGYRTVHVGLITRVEDRGEGVYLLETVEGNLASRIKRLSYLYDSKTPDPKQNMFMLPEGEQNNPEIFQYQLSSDDWRVTAFAQTWY
jgi:hypothetical protein